ncbi:SAM-dependent methyltransferase [Sphingobium sp. B7D2B]|uniref:class I SAM-dependent methyltransferase n=1 Tax=Sphingobium sp. B7D2B TaxID=2940583 RepID=UPI002224F2A5|nr:class I SAM-dependent methyltransferase [Sphingobium sp. B7D2B]MCW2366814.1 SAM-dependent methyltransferase [Sphingobium sp. B7D2B]
MNDISRIFEKLRDSQMNDWIGGSDPEVVGDAMADIIRRLIPFDENSRMLDFGCGIGRGMLALYKEGVVPAQSVGVDIMPPVIEFCRENIESALPGTSFELIEGSNDHYDRFIGDEPRKSIDQFTKDYEGRFTHGYAFSVFTHIDRKDFEDVLSTVSKVLAPGGKFLFTCFTLTQFSRYMIDREQPVFPLSDRVLVDNGEVLWGHKSDPLAFIAFDKNLLEQMVWNAGLAITKVDYGCWMGGQIGSSLHDLIVVTKPLPLATQEEIVYTPLVDRNSFG